MAKKITKKSLLEMAKGLNLKGVQNLKKEVLIHNIQTAEGNNPCFKNIQGCGINSCLFRTDCQA